MRRWLAVVFVAFVGCGDGSDAGGPGVTVPPPVQYADRVLGNWLLDKGTAGIGVNFIANNQYSIVVLAAAADLGSFNTQLENGTYRANASVVTFTPAQSTCPGPHPPYGEMYSVTATSLTLSDASGALLFARNTSQGGSAVATYGCFASDGTFTPSPLAPVN